jgi:hypothetical protein
MPSVLQPWIIYVIGQYWKSYNIENTGAIVNIEISKYLIFKLCLSLILKYLSDYAFG